MLEVEGEGEREIGVQRSRERQEKVGKSERGRID